MLLRKFVQTHLQVKMPQLSSMQASIFALLVFVATLVVNFYLPGYSLSLSGFLVVIFLSVFVETRSSTIIAGLLSTACIFLFFLFNKDENITSRDVAELLFLVTLVLFATLIVLFIKSLLRDIQWDKSHMSSLFENATEGIILTNSKAEIILVNPSACRMFGYEQEQMVGEKIEKLLPKKFRSGHVQLRKGFYQHPQNRVMGSGRDLYGEKKGGENFPVEVSLSAYKQHGEQYVIAFIVDITHRKEIEQSMLQQKEQLEKVTADIRKLNSELEAKVEERTLILKEALQRLEQSQAEVSAALDKEKQLNEIKSRFVSMASHEFRTPLSAILSSASLLGKYTSSEQQTNRDKHINRIKESIKHLNDLLEDFLSLGKLEEGKTTAFFAPFNLPASVQDMIDEVRGLVKDGQLITYEHSGNEEIVSDKKLLKNILINLLSNAIKFSSNTIVVNSEVEDGQVRISVNDQGIGISKEDQRHLFTSFFRGKNAQNIPGTGLGLHIVKRYADLLGGKLKLRSTLGSGTTITLLFPLNNEPNDKDDLSN